MIPEEKLAFTLREQAQNNARQRLQRRPRIDLPDLLHLSHGPPNETILNEPLRDHFVMRTVKFSKILSGLLIVALLIFFHDGLGAIGVSMITTATMTTGPNVKYC